MTLTIRDSVIENISSVLDRRRFLSRMAGALAEHSGYQQIAIYTCDRDQREYFLRARTSAVPDFMPERLSQPEPSEGNSVRWRAETSYGLDGIRFESYTWVPIYDGGRSVGLVVALPGASNSFEDDEVRNLESLVREIAPAIAVCEEHEAVLRSSVVDLDTGSYTFEYLNQRLSEEISRASRTHSSITIILIEAMDFHDFELRAGYDVADELIRRTGGAVSSVLRDSDVVARKGRSGFLALMPESDQRGASTAIDRVIKRIRSVIDEMRVGDDIDVLPRFLVGQSWFPSDGADATAVLLAAEQRLMEQELLSKHVTKF